MVVDVVEIDSVFVLSPSFLDWPLCFLLESVLELYFGYIYGLASDVNIRTISTTRLGLL